MEPGFYTRKGSGVVLFLLKKGYGYMITQKDDSHTLGEFGANWVDTFNIPVSPTDDLLTKLMKIDISQVHRCVVEGFIGRNTNLQLFIDETIVEINFQIIFDMEDVIFMENLSNSMLTLVFKNSTSKTIFINEKIKNSILKIYKETKSKRMKL